MTIHPDDDNGEVLRRLEAKGDELSKPRNVDFSVVFPSKDAAEKFAEHFSAQSYETSVYFAEDSNDLPWNVNVVKPMALSYDAIVSFEAFLQEVADTLGGQNDGWGCFSEPKQH